MLSGWEPLGWSYMHVKPPVSAPSSRWPLQPHEQLEEALARQCVVGMASSGLQGRGQTERCQGEEADRAVPGGGQTEQCQGGGADRAVSGGGGRQSSVGARGGGGGGGTGQTVQCRGGGGGEGEAGRCRLDNRAQGYIAGTH